MNFAQKLDRAIEKNNSLLCVGLDSNKDNLPASFQHQEHPQFAFNKHIIDQTHQFVCAYKPNSAFYEARGADGITDLKMTCDYLHKNHPEIPIILDAKRGDIGSTNQGYVKFVFEYLRADAITLHPYLGREAIQPFLDRKEKGAIILCRTSNPGASEFQDISGLYKKVAKAVVSDWNKNGNCLLVVGATYPKELAEIRKIVGEMTLLIPGIGAQGGDIQATLKAGLNSQGRGLIISSSRSIIFAKSPRAEAEKLREEINSNRV